MYRRRWQPGHPIDKIKHFVQNKADFRVDEMRAIQMKYIQRELLRVFQEEPPDFSFASLVERSRLICSN